MNMNENEKNFLEVLRNAEANIFSPYEMEVQYCYYNDPNLDGWYVYKYNKERGESIPATGENRLPIIASIEAEKLNIDVVKCLNEYGCYYVG